MRVGVPAPYNARTLEIAIREAVGGPGFSVVVVPGDAPFAEGLGRAASQSHEPAA